MLSSRLILPVLAVGLVIALGALVVKVRAPAERAERAQAEDGNTEESPPPARKQSLPQARKNPALAGAAKRRPRPARTADVTAPSADEPVRPTPPTRGQLSEKRLDLNSRMRAANKSYDRGDYPQAEEQALVILEEQPANTRMLRIVVSASCITGKHEQAQEYYAKLPARDQKDMRKRCQDWGLKLEDEDTKE